jgi:methionyl-tRNA synthetase
MPQVVEVEEETAIGSPSYPVITGDYTGGGRWESTPLPVGRPLSPPTPLFRKLDASVVDDELARMSS